MENKTRMLTETALLTALITVTGALKLPGFVPGTEFQLSAPLAVAICGVFGITNYLTAGVLSSVMGLILGTQTILNVFIAMVFRVTVAIVIGIFGTSWPSLFIAGPIGSSLARLSLGGILGNAVIPLLLAAVPGMIYTALAAYPLTMLLRRVKAQTAKVIGVVQR